MVTPFDDDTLVPLGQQAEAFAAATRRFSGHIGCLVGVDVAGRVLAKGTVTFVRIEDAHLLATAAHVIDGLLELDCEYRLLILPPASVSPEPIMRMPCTPIAFRIDLSAVLGASWAALDVAVLTTTDEIVAGVGDRWIDGRRHSAATATVRGMWRRDATESTPLACSVFGFPNFGHVVDQEQHRELLASIPIPAYVTQMDEHAWLGSVDGVRVPPMQLELDFSQPDNVREGLSPFEDSLSQGAFREDGDRPVLGGLSGGPVIVVGSDGEYLIGIVREAARICGSARVLASAWDDVVSALDEDRRGSTAQCLP